MGAPLKTHSTLDRAPALLVLAVISLLCLGAGLASAYFFYVRPAQQVAAAQAWVQVPCRILSSDLQRHSGKHTSYSLSLSYDYQYNGQDYQATQLDFSEMKSGDYRWWKSAQSRHPARKADVCFVNPADPSQAVLERSFDANPGTWLFPGFFLVFGFCTLAPLIYGLSRRLKYGETYLEIGDAPVPLGGALAGQLLLSRRLQPPEGFTLKLANLHQVMVGEGKGRHAEINVLWESGPQVVYAADEEITVNITLPAQGCQTSAGSANRIYWQLDVHAKVPGVDYAARFEVPVAGLVPPRRDEMANVVEATKAPTAEASFTLPAHSNIQVNDVIGNGSVTVTKRLFGLGVPKTIAVGDVAEVRTAPGATMQTGGRVTVLYNVQIVCRDGRKITAGDEVADLHEAHWLALEMARCAGVGQA